MNDQQSINNLVQLGADRNRTCDILLAKQALSQLSYSPELGDAESLPAIAVNTLR
jgi:hypothetical protein